LVAHAGDGVLDSLDVGLLRDMLHLCTALVGVPHGGVRHILLMLLRVACVAHGEEELVGAAEARVRREEHAKRQVRVKEAGRRGIQSTILPFNFIL
jgi:hypothetical protein